jgi:hypothetical protein
LVIGTRSPFTSGTRSSTQIDLTSTAVSMTAHVRSGGKIVTARKGLAFFTITTLGQPADAGVEHRGP